MAWWKVSLSSRPSAARAGTQSVFPRNSKLRVSTLGPGLRFGFAFACRDDRWQQVLIRSAASVLTATLALPAAAEFRHGLSAFGDLKYPADFAHFEYVKPDAPKGGRLALIGAASRSTFDSLNGYILKGDAAQGLEYVFDSLMTRGLDEPDAVYGLVARDAEVAADGFSVTFRLRPEAKFSDGTPVTADDVVFSFDVLKEKGAPQYRTALVTVTKATALDPATVRYEFTGDLTRDLPLTVAQLPIFSKAYYASRPFDETTLDAPIGSGPYKVGEVRAGTFITYLRRDDYWAKELPVNLGRFNFAELRYEYYRDRRAQLEALFAGAYDLREEFTSQSWAQSYNIPIVADGRLQRVTLADDSPSGAQGFFINMRRDKFGDPRVRRALDLAFDFEWSNKNLFFGMYTRTASYFENSDLKATGAPTSDELALLEPFRAELPPAVFAAPYVPPTSDGSGSDRKLLREAQGLLKDAGWLDPGGKRLEVELLIDEPTFEKVVGPYVENLKRIGIVASIRRVDPSQYERRIKSFDFDLAMQRFSMRLTPGIELANFFGSATARMDGSYNLPGIESKAVDALISKILAAKSRAELTVASRALDRVLRAGHYWVPCWYKASHHVAHWDRFSRPEIKPKYERGIIHTWWYDAAKAAKLAATR